MSTSAFVFLRADYQQKNNKVVTSRKGEGAKGRRKMERVKVGGGEQGEEKDGGDGVGWAGRDEGQEEGKDGERSAESMKMGHLTG